MIRNKHVWDKHYYSNRFTVRNIFYYVTVDFALYVSLRQTIELDTDVGDKSMGIVSK